MRNIALAALILAAIPLHVDAAPCALGSLNTYLGLGAGCSVGSALFTNFSVAAAPGATAIPASDIQVSPLISASSLGLSFGLNAFAGPGQIFGDTIGFHVFGPLFSGSTLSLQGSSVNEDGAVTAVETLPKSLVAFDIGSVADLTAQTTFAPLASFDGAMDLTVDGGTEGSAGLNGSVANTFTLTPTVATPEPSASWLLASGLVALGLVYQRKNPSHKSIHSSSRQSLKPRP